MFTECPACQTMFRVTGAILRAGHGQVECGQCHTIFDAIERLIDDVPQASGTYEPARADNPPTLPPLAADPADPELPAATQAWANDLPTGEFLLKDGELIPVGIRPESALAPEPTPNDIEVDEPDAPEEITLEGDRIEISGVYQRPESWPETEPEPETEEPVLPPQEDAPIAAAAPAAEYPPLDDDLEATLGNEERPGGRTAIWAAASLVLVIGLLAQAIHHYRQELVRHPRLGPTLLKVYAAANLPLAPNWDVTGYEIQQWGVAADPAATGTLRLRASIMNRAGFAQPYPLIQLTLEDRWGERVGARAFEPAEYLGPGTPTDRLLAPNQRVNADIGIVDPGEDAVGFHVDVCLRTESGTDCASERRGAQ